MKDNKAKDSGNTISSKMFPGGHIAIVSAKSGPQLQSRPRRLVLFDEVDRYDTGDPIGHGEMRTARFWNRKIGMFSTPEDKDTSKIERAYEAGTREEWQLPCPACGAYQPLAFNDQLDHTTYLYACRECGVQSGEFAWKSGAGKWVARAPLEKCRSFHLNALVSPGLHWEEIVAKFHAATSALKTGDREPYKNFVTQILGESFEEQGEAADESTFTKNRHWYGGDIPAGVLVLTAQADVQDDRVEVELRGYDEAYFGPTDGGKTRHALHGGHAT
ncbi:MAG TPA: terminase gpA endonuclease subunit [Armatimonadota bacterium]|nr:terminase gpA endonuclease subunit [Armatimonadota bacterium]